MAITEEARKTLLDKEFPKTVGGMVRPDEPIPTDFTFHTDLPQFIQPDPVLYTQENLFLRQLLSNDKIVKELVEAIQNQLANCDLRIVTEVLKGLMSPDMLKKLNGIQAGALNNPHPANHPATMITQDGTHRFVSDAEKNNWNSKANANHGQHTPAKETANNARFLRNDATWQTITPGNIGAAAAANANLTGDTKAVHFLASQGGAGHGYSFQGDGAADTGMFSNADGDLYFMKNGVKITYEPAFSKGSAFNKNFGTAAGTVCQGNDARLANARPANGGNSDTVDGLHAHGGRNNEANKLVRTNGNGYIDITHINSDQPVNNGNVANVIYDNGDGYFRKCTLAHLIAKITAGGGGGIVASSLAQNGYVKFANGLILQWGRTSSGSERTVTFPISFKTFCRICVLKYGQSDGYQRSDTGLLNSSVTGFSWNTYGPCNCFDWIAIGI